MKKIFIVDDDPGLLENMAFMIKNEGYDVTVAQDGKKALNILKKEQFDAIILDDNLPFIQGSDIMGLVRLQAPSALVILMSGLFDEKYMYKMREQGADMVIEKPFDFETIAVYLQANLS